MVMFQPAGDPSTTLGMTEHVAWDDEARGLG